MVGPHPWDLQVRVADLSEFPINSRVHIHFILRKIKRTAYLPILSFRGDMGQKL